MNILQILPTLDVGGVETGTIDLARYLVSKGHRAVTVSGGGRLVKRLDEIGCRHYSLPVGKKSIFKIISMINALKEIIRREDIDIVHARSRVPAVIAYFACKDTGRVFITTAHGYYKKHLLSQPMSWGKFVIVASSIMAKHMVNNFGVPYDRIRLIPRGVDLARFEFRDPAAHYSNEFVVGMVSRITPLKGHADFIKAVSIASRSIPNIKAVIVGDAPKPKYKEDLELLVRGLGLTEIVEFVSATEDVPSIMKKLDLLVSATITPEAFGRVIIEAQAIGVPVVATKVGGVVDIIDNGKTGLLCMPQDPKDMASKMSAIYKDTQLWKDIAVNGRKKVESDFNLELMTKKTLTVYEESLKRQNILIIKISATGDVILSTPSLKAIRAKFPDANIKVLVGVQSREILDRCPYINDVIVCDLKARDKGIKGLWGLIKKIQSHCFDIVIDLQNNRKSHILAFASMAPSRYGYDNGKLSFLLNRKIKDDAPYLDPLEHQFRTLRLVGIKPVDKKIELWPSSSDEDNVKKFLQDNWVKDDKGLVGINMRASSKWVTKNWPAAYVAELCDRLAREFNMRAVLTGTKEDFDFASRIAKMSKSKPIIAAGKTSVMELVCLIRHFKVYLTPDSAPMHIASSVGTPLVALFGPTDPRRHMVMTENSIVLCKSGELKCSPCYSPSCIKNFACMRKISVNEVMDAMKKIFKGRDSQAEPAGNGGEPFGQRKELVT